MPLDPRIIASAGQGVTPIRDPLQTLGAVYQFQGLQQQQQLHQMQLAQAQRQEQERGTLARAFQGAVRTDPTTGQTSLDLPAAFSAAYRTSSNPLAVLKAEQDYGKSQGESRKLLLEAKKAQLEQQGKALEFGGQVAQGIEARIAAGADPQAAWEWGINTMRQAGMPTQGITPFYDANMLAGWKGQAQQIKDKIAADQKVVDQQLAEHRLALDTRTENRLQRAEGRAETKATREEREAAQQVPAYTGDATLNVAIARRMQERGLTGQPPPDVLQQAQEDVRQGKVDPSAAQRQVGDREKDLRTEFNTLTKDYRTVADAYGRIQSAQETGPGDISLIFSYMKLLDPTSTVREGEFATAQNAGGVPERLIAQYNRLISGERLAPETRTQFLDQAQGLYDQATRDYQRTKTRYEDLATRYGADPANVTADFGSTAPPRARPAAPGTGKVLSEQDITDTIAAEKAKGRTVTRQQVIDAARGKGYQVP